jgi:hypothetical protein
VLQVDALPPRRGKNGATFFCNAKSAELGTPNPEADLEQIKVPNTKAERTFISYRCEIDLIRAV